MVENKRKCTMECSFQKNLANILTLTVYGVHEKGDMEYDKNFFISGHRCFLIEHVTELNMFNTAGCVCVMMLMLF
jgi:hypothetical protein